MRFQNLVFAACAGVALLAAAPAAHADPDGWHGRGHWEHDRWERGHWAYGPRGPYWVRGYPPAVVYAPPPVVYAPPPVVYAPPPPVVYAPPGISLGINIPIH